jgi:site-specific recombinase XerD
MPAGAVSSTVVSDGLVIEPIEEFLGHLSAIERSPNTVKAYAHDLSDYFSYLKIRDVDWAEVHLDDHLSDLRERPAISRWHAGQPAHLLQRQLLLHRALFRSNGGGRR